MPSRRKFHATGKCYSDFGNQTVQQSGRLAKKKFLRVIYLSCWIAFCHTASCTAGNMPLSLKDKAAITAFIHRQAQQEHGEEYADARKTMTGDLDGDGKPETVVLYTIEGHDHSINYEQHLAVFLQRHGHLMPITHLSVGGKGIRFVELVSIDKKMIHFDTILYDHDDALCCPSINSSTSYILTGKTLREQKRKRGKFRHE